MPGVSCKQLPISYTQKYFAQEIKRDTQQFLLDHFVNEGVQNYTEKHQLAIINWPRLSNINGNTEEGYKYTFALSLAPSLDISDWQQNTFIAPKRKNYTDLDTQVSSFVQKLDAIEPATDATIVEPGDWVRFKAQLRTPHLTTPLHSAAIHWLQITSPHATTTCMQHFVGAHIGQTFQLPATALIDLQPDAAPTDYEFDVTIDSVIKAAHLGTQTIQHSLHTKTPEELHDKLIEVFSYRNDVSLRKAIIEELFYILFSIYRFDIAPHAITRRKELLLTLMQNSPDSLVYTKQKHFLPHITLLAEAKLKEEALIDTIATYENIQATQDDITSYLSLYSNERIKEFLYFAPLTDDIMASDQPCSEYNLSQIVRREKTLNFVIKQLAI